MKDTLQRILLSLSLLDPRVDHVFREANTLANSLALIGSNIQCLTSYFSFNSLPLRSRHLLLYDARGMPSVRLCQ